MDANKVRVNAGASPSPRVIVWDFPMRICHWGFAFSFSAALYIGYRFHPESTIFKYHMWAGLVAAYFLIIRVILGFCGSQPARWRNFFFSPLQTVVYIYNILRWKSMTHPGINPGTSLMAMGLYSGLGGLIYTGFMQDSFSHWHDPIASGVFWLILAHLLGLVLHAAREREWIFLAMIDGRKRGAGEANLVSPHWRIGGLILVVSAGVIGCAYYYFDVNRDALAIPGLPELLFPFIEVG